MIYKYSCYLLKSEQIQQKSEDSEERHTITIDIKDHKSRVKHVQAATNDVINSLTRSH